MKITLILIINLFIYNSIYTQVLSYNEFKDIKINLGFHTSSRFVFAFEDNSAYFIIDNKIVCLKNRQLNTIEIPTNLRECIHELTPHTVDLVNKKSYHINGNNKTMAIVDYSKPEVTFEEVDLGFTNTIVKNIRIEIVPYKNSFLLLISELKQSMTSSEIEKFSIRKYNIESKQFENLFETKENDFYSYKSVGIIGNNLVFCGQSRKMSENHFQIIVKKINLTNLKTYNVKTFQKEIKLKKKVEDIGIRVGGSIFEKQNKIYIYTTLMSMSGEQQYEIIENDTTFELLNESSFISPVTVNPAAEVAELDFFYFNNDFHFIDQGLYFDKNDKDISCNLEYIFDNESNSLELKLINKNYRAAGIYPDSNILDPNGLDLGDNKHKTYYNTYIAIIDVPYTQPENNTFFVCRVLYEGKRKKHSGYIAFIEVPYSN